MPDKEELTRKRCRKTQRLDHNLSVTRGFAANEVLVIRLIVPRPRPLAAIHILLSVALINALDFFPTISSVTLQYSQEYNTQISSLPI